LNFITYVEKLLVSHNCISSFKDIKIQMTGKSIKNKNYD